MVWIIVVVAECLLLIAAGIAIMAQREVIAKKNSRHWENEREIAGLEEKLDRATAANNLLRDRANDAITQALEYASKPPVVIDPPDVVSIVRELGESIGTAIYGRQQAVMQDLEKQIRETSMVEEKIKPGEWFPDVEFDDTMGPMPAKGGWINGPVNAQQPPPEGQTPTHVVVDGQLKRVDGQSVFQAGVSAPPPTGGIE